MIVLSGMRKLLVAVALISAAVNLLMLASPIYMLQVFDRVVTGRSLETLFFLSIIVFAALMVMGALDACRAVVLARLGDWLDRRLGGDIMAAAVDMGAQPAARSTPQPIADLAAVRQFLTSPGVGALFDAPWIPFFIAMIWYVNPLLGVIAVASAVLLAVLAFAGEILTRRTSEQAGLAAMESQTLLDTTLSNSDVVRSMGLLGGLQAHWGMLRERQSHFLLQTTSRLAILSSSSRAMRLAVQSAILGAGAYLVLDRSISPGEMIAASIILSRALAPVEVAIASWRQLISARNAWRRLGNLLRRQEQRPQQLVFPEPVGRLQLDKVVLQSGPGAEPILRNIAFDLPTGEMLGVVGSSASGKSSLGRLLVGAWWPNSGSVRLDGTELAQWDGAALGCHVGYVPQIIDLFSGTVRDNIARFSEAPLSEVIRAAELAGAHEMIQKLPQGYNSQVGNRGERLSGGQRQRIALARAVFGNPCLVVLDEPDSNLDQTGAEGLVHCLQTLKDKGVTVIIIAHRRNTLSQCDKLLWLEEGQIKAYGPAPLVIERLEGQTPKPLRVVTGKGDEK